MSNLTQQMTATTRAGAPMVSAPHVTLHLLQVLKELASATPLCIVINALRNRG